MFFFFTYLGY